MNFSELRRTAEQVELKLNARHPWAVVYGNMGDVSRVILAVDAALQQEFGESLSDAACEAWYADRAFLLSGLAAWAFGDLAKPLEVECLDNSLWLLDKMLEADVLREHQHRVAVSMLRAPCGRGIVDVAMGGGKTRIALAVMACRSAARVGYGCEDVYDTLGEWVYVAPNQELADRIVEETESDVGRELLAICGLSERWMPVALTFGQLTVSAETNDPLQVEGLIVDECHASAAKTRREALLRVHAEYRLGMSGTPLGRLENNHLVIGLLGPVIASVGVQELTELGVLCDGKVKVL